jgi:hypothetical protein
MRLDTLLILDTCQRGVGNEGEKACFGALLAAKAFLNKKGMDESKQLMKCRS